MRHILKFLAIISFAVTLSYLMLPHPFEAAAEVRFIEALTGDKLYGKLKQPSALFFSEEKSRLYIADTGNNRLVSFDSEFKFRAKFDAGGNLKNPTSFVKNSKGQFFILQGGKAELLFIDIENKISRTIEIKNIAGMTNAVFPGKLAIDKNDNLYLTDRGNGQILVLDQQGQYIRNIMFENKPVDFSDIRVDKSGYIYSLSTLEGKIYVFDPNGKIISQFGRRGSKKDEFLFPTSIAVTPNGLIYVLDKHKGSVLVFKKDGKFQFSFSKKGQNTGELYLPSHIITDNKGKIYIADRGNNRVQIFSEE